MNSKTQFSGKCVFCGGGNLTKEHIWSDWLTKRGLLPRTENHTQHKIFTEFDESSGISIVTPEIPKNKQGALIQEQVRRVCRNCNNGWMKNIVDAAIMPVEAILNDLKFDLSPKAQSDISSWIALSSIMAEFTDIKTMAIPERDRTYMFHHHTPPADWRIYIGRYEGDEWAPSRYRHYGFKFRINNPFLIIDTNSDVHHFQTSTYTLGLLAVYVFSTTEVNLAKAFSRRPIPDGMVQIWPPCEEISWPPRPTLGDNDMMNISDRFLNDFLKKQV